MQSSEGRHRMEVESCSASDSQTQPFLGEKSDFNHHNNSSCSFRKDENTSCENSSGLIASFLTLDDEKLKMATPFKADEDSLQDLDRVKLKDSYEKFKKQKIEIRTVKYFAHHLQINGEEICYEDGITNGNKCYFQISQSGTFFDEPPPETSLSKKYKMKQERMPGHLGEENIGFKLKEEENFPFCYSLKKTINTQKLDRRFWNRSFSDQLFLSLEVCSIEDAIFILKRVPIPGIRTNNFNCTDLRKGKQRSEESLRPQFLNSHRHFVEILQNLSVERLEELLEDNSFFIEFYKCLHQTVSKSRLTVQQSQDIDTNLTALIARKEKSTQSEILHQSYRKRHESNTLNRESNSKVLTKSYERLLYLLEALNLESVELFKALQEVTAQIVEKQMSSSEFLRRHILQMSGNKKRKYLLGTESESELSEADEASTDSEMLRNDLSEKSFDCDTQSQVQDIEIQAESSSNRVTRSRGKKGKSKGQKGLKADISTSLKGQEKQKNNKGSIMSQASPEQFYTNTLKVIETCHKLKSSLDLSEKGTVNKHLFNKEFFGHFKQYFQWSHERFLGLDSDRKRQLSDGANAACQNQTELILKTVSVILEHNPIQFWLCVFCGELSMPCQRSTSRLIGNRSKNRFNALQFLKILLSDFILGKSIGRIQLKGISKKSSEAKVHKKEDSGNFDFEDLSRMIEKLLTLTEVQNTFIKQNVLQIITQVFSIIKKIEPNSQFSAKVQIIDKLKLFHTYLQGYQLRGQSEQKFKKIPINQETLQIIFSQTNSEIQSIFTVLRLEGLKFSQEEIKGSKEKKTDKILKTKRRNRRSNSKKDRSQSSSVRIKNQTPLYFEEKTDSLNLSDSLSTKSDFVSSFDSSLPTLQGAFGVRVKVLIKTNRLRILYLLKVSKMILMLIQKNHLKLQEIFKSQLEVNFAEKNSSSKLSLSKKKKSAPKTQRNKKKANMGQKQSLNQNSFLETFMNNIRKLSEFLDEFNSKVQENSNQSHKNFLWAVNQELKKSLKDCEMVQAVDRKIEAVDESKIDSTGKLAQKDTSGSQDESISQSSRGRKLRKTNRTQPTDK